MVIIVNFFRDIIDICITHLKIMQKNPISRMWFYARNGWGVYFALIFGALNTLVVTYYLAIEQIPELKIIFPTFSYYVIAALFIGVPLLTFIGFVHFKRSTAFQSEADIVMETHPHFRRILDNTEITLSMFIKLSELLIKISNKESIPEKELTNLENLQKNLQDYIDQSSLKGKNRLFDDDSDNQSSL